MLHIERVYAWKPEPYFPDRFDLEVTFEILYGQINPVQIVAIQRDENGNLVKKLTGGLKDFVFKRSAFSKIMEPTVASLKYSALRHPDVQAAMST